MGPFTCLVRLMMNMDENRLNDFLKRFAENRYTEEEHSEFLNWLHTAPIEEIQHIIEKYLIIAELNDHNDQVLYPELITKIENRLDELERDNIVVIKPGRYNLRQAIAIASIVLISLLGWMYVWRNHKVEKPINQITKAKNHWYKNDITPGKNKAILTLANGSKIVLDAARNGTLANQGNTVIHKEKDGEVVYDHINSANNSVSDIAYNTISTPLGGQYQIILPDGSKVWLNAASSLKFPATFSGNERRVELVGEAYFEVAKNKEKPFKVSANNMQVEVLGTHFNIMAYRNENSTNTTLLEGSVKIIRGNESRTIKPGQQAKAGDNNIQVLNVNAEDAMAWKNGYFNFSHENIEVIMRKIARWYNIETVYEGPVTKEDFAGTISRYKNVSEVLHTLELTGLIHFRIEGRRITVMR